MKHTLSCITALLLCLLAPCTDRAERSQLDAMVRQKDSTEVQAMRNQVTDAPTVPEVMVDDKKQP